MACAAAMSAGASNNAPTISPNGILLRKSASSLAIEAAIQAQSGSGSNCERAARRQRSAPDRLDLGENRVRVAGACQDRIKARVLTTGQQPGREGALRSAAAASALPAAIGDGRDSVLVHRDVVEIAQAILHSFERGEELRAPPRRLLAGEEVAEELRCVAHLLRLDAQLVAAPRIEPGELLALLADLAEAPVNCSAAEVSIATSPRPRTRSSCGLVHCPASSQAAISSVRARNRGERTASWARASASARCCVRSCERPEMPSRRECRRRTGATTCVTSTSSSRAGPSSPVSHFSSSLSAVVCGSCRISANKEVAARSRRSPTRIWCTPSGSPASSAGSLPIICLRQASPTALKPSRVVAPGERSTATAFTGASSWPASIS